ncbi:IPT/TIG domain-containing protein [Proteiniphilum sp. UBA5384]|uniref:IPT/TIG domain-containing protein n=1 Tax=Proteiniphilum sp. UBA5384 TaxID=1947279 RepID=UPI0025E80D62|nr:IPT/TIG domain-containing protein [Proteiniphilum sp. UBA5384]
MKKEKIYVILFLFFMAFLGCKDSNEGQIKEDHDPSKPIKLTSFFPDHGRIREKVILEGENFGSDPDKIKVYFNKKRASVVGSNGKNMYVIVPRVIDSLSTISVVIGNDSLVYDDLFKYKVTISVTTIAGDGTASIRPGALEQSQLKPFQLDVDQFGNIFVGTDNTASGAASYSSDGLVRINEEENTMELVNKFPNVANSRFEGLNCDKETGVFYTAVRTGTLEYAIIDPAEGWIPRYRTISFNTGGKYPIPTTNGNYMGYSSVDKHMYSRYSGGEIAKINPETGKADIIFKSPETGTSIGIDIDPTNPNMLYIGGYSGTIAHGIYRLDLNDPENSWVRLNINTGAGHRDGPIEGALFNTIYGLRFDPDGIMYISDYKNYCIRKYDPSTGMVETVLGIPGQSGMRDGGKEEAMFHSCTAIGIGVDGTIYIADRGNNRVRKLSIE